MAERPKLLSELGKARFNRASGMGLNGLAASTIGIAMLGCIALGYFGGSWLDRKLGSTWAMPVGAFLGMIAGFVEMFRTLKKVTDSTRWPGAKNGPTVASSNEKTSAREGTPITGSSDHTIKEEPQGEIQERKRLFEVPPPPLPEFGASVQKVNEPSAEDVSKRLHENLDKTTAEHRQDDND